MRTLMRFNMVMPTPDRQENGVRHRAMLEMCRYADVHGFNGVTLEEHHGAENGWSSSPLVLAGLILGATSTMQVNISALLVPLHDPVRIAEDIAALDLASGRRLIVIAGIGYRPAEHAAPGKDWANRGALMDEGIAVMRRAWTGEQSKHLGATIRVTPLSATMPHPM